MGYNTTIVVYNDALDQIAKDEQFGKKLVAAVMRVGAYGNPEDISSGNHANAARVIESHHADTTAIVAVGGNDGTVIASHFGWNHGDLDWQERVLKERLKEIQALKKTAKDTPGMGY